MRRNQDGGIRISMSREAAEVLRDLPTRMRAVLERPDFASGPASRLFPKAYEDPEKEAEFQRLLGDDLRHRKLQSVATFENSLGKWKARGRKIEIQVDASAFDLWLGFVNDMRLVLGAALDIQNDEWGRSFDPTHPRASEFELLHYLSWLEESLLAAR
jgi:hypothetical protein